MLIKCGKPCSEQLSSVPEFCGHFIGRHYIDGRVKPFRFTCCENPFTYGNSPLWLHHFRTAHSCDEYVFCCNFKSGSQSCTKSFSELARFTAHYTEVHGEKTYFCICGIRYSTLRRLNEHVKKANHRKSNSRIIHIQSEKPACPPEWDNVLKVPLSWISGRKAESFQICKAALSHTEPLQHRFDQKSPFNVLEPCIFPQGDYVHFIPGKAMKEYSMLAEVIKAMLRPVENNGLRMSSLKPTPLQGDLKSINATILTQLVQPDPEYMLAFNIPVGDVMQVKVPAAITDKMHYDSLVLKFVEANLTPMHAGLRVHLGKLYVKML
jgi:hypothetical protein